MAAALLPGIIGIVNHHPYEYTYYNTVSTALTPIFRRYETDYWATSFKQAAAFLNENAAQDSNVIVWGPDQLIERYARKDLHVKSFDELSDQTYAAGPYYLVLTTRYDMDTKFFPDIEPVYTVDDNHCVYAVIKYITP
jgi:hypothetical protein